MPIFHMPLVALVLHFPPQCGICCLYNYVRKNCAEYQKECILVKEPFFIVFIHVIGFLL